MAAPLTQKWAVSCFLIDWLITPDGSRSLGNSPLTINLGAGLDGVICKGEAHWLPLEV